MEVHRFPNGNDQPKHWPEDSLFGLDDPGKIKSIKLPHGYIGILWFEELDQYDGPEQIRNVEQSCLRGGDFSFTFKSFNPPASPRNWANRYALEVRDRKIVQHSDYTMVPQEWLGRRFLDDAEDLKQRNLIAYNHEYLGEVTGCGKEVLPTSRLSASTRPGSSASTTA